MANLDFILSLKEGSPIQKKVLEESIDISNVTNQCLDYIQESREEQMVLLFIELTDSCQKKEKLNSKEFKENLDYYYSSVLEIITKNGGTPFQIIGYDIICFWGQSVSGGDVSENRGRAIECAKTLIEIEYEIKVSLHEEKIFYHKIESRGHSEFTLTGKPITELFRLAKSEASKSNAINYFIISGVSIYKILRECLPEESHEEEGFDDYCNRHLSGYIFSDDTKNLRGVVGERKIRSATKKVEMKRVKLEGNITSVTNLNEAIASSNVNQHWDYIINSKEEQMVLLFIDITDFSTKMKDCSSEVIKAYLNRYYELVLPIIHEHNGIVFQIIGDGILCFWGEPFSKGKLKDKVRQAEECAEKLLFNAAYTFYLTSGFYPSYESKIALHAGKVFYHEIKSSKHYEFTLSGQTVVELFSLESVSESNAITYILTQDNKESPYGYWIFKKKVVDLKGLGKRKICSKIYQP